MKQKHLDKLEHKLNLHNRTKIEPSQRTYDDLEVLMSKYDLRTPIPSEIIPKYDVNSWRMFLGNKGVYQLPTIELIDFLRHLIQGKQAIEICCGHGTIGYTLGIPTSDRKLSEGTGNEAADLSLQSAQNAWSRHPYDFPKYVENLTAYQAVEKYKPQVVIGCWVTEKNRHKRQGSGYGVEEDKIIDRVETYIHTGSSMNPLHSKKWIAKFQHWTIEADWLFDRGSTKGPSQLKIWTKEEPNWDAFPENLEFDIL
jgi:hypothetical protein